MEAHCLRKLEASPCIATLFCEFHGPADWLGVLELCEGGELWEEIKHCGCLSAAEMAWFASQMAEAIATVHEHGVTHRDIKCENFLLTLPEKTVKLIDFGTARDTENPEVKTMMLGPQYEHHVGTPNFMAPEAVDGKANDRRSDLWSLGCAFSQMLLGVPPFHEVAQQRWKDIKEEVKFPDANSDSDDEGEEEEEEKKKEAQDVNPKASTNTEGVVPTGSALKGKWSTYAQLAKTVTNVIEEPKKQCCELM